MIGAGDLAQTQERIRRLSEAQRSVLLRKMRERGLPLRALPIVSSGRDPSEPAPLTSAQRRLWLLERLEPGQRFSRIAVAVRLAGPLDAEVLRAAVADVAARHGALRTSFHEQDGDVVQAAREGLAPEFSVVDLSRLDPAARDGSLARTRAAFEARPFDPAREALLRVLLVRSSPHEHVLLASMHHLIGDAWSMDVCARDLARAYRLRAGADPAAETPAADLPIQLADYARWERELQALGERDDDLRFFRDALAGAPEESTFPADFARPAVRTSDAGLLARALEPSAAAALRALAARSGTTPFAVLLACVAVVLRRFAAQPDLVVGTVLANRERPEAQDLIGALVNTLPIRVRVDDGEPFAALLGRAAEAAAATVARQAVPFEDVLAALGSRTDPARTPVFQVVVILQNAHRSELRFPLVQAHVLPAQTAGAMHDVTFAWREDENGGYALEVEYARESYRAETAAAVADALLAVCRAVACDPGVPVGDLARPAAAPATVPAGEPERSADEAFAAWARARPDAPAIVAQTGALTYGELGRRTARLAAALREAGVPAGGRVAIAAAHDGVAAATAMLAVNRAGAAFALLETGGGARADAVLDALRPDAIVATRATTQAAHVLGLPTVVYEHALEAGGDAGGGTAVPAGAAAYVAFTSGSTGRPKGIVQSRRAFAQFLAWQARAFGLGAASAVGMWSPLVFDACYTEVYGALASGGVLHVADYARRMDPRYVAAWLDRGHVGYYLTVPSFLRLLLDELARPGAPGLPALAHLAVSGEVLDPALVERFRTVLPHVRLHNLYGPTECVLATHAVVARGYSARERVPAGYPIAGRAVVVLDEALRLVPACAVGELVVRSAFLTDGYLGMPDETRRRYVPAGGGELFYRTGDRGRVLPSGELEFLGRQDTMVKVRGCRVELGEVESALASHPQVRQCAVAARERGASGTILVAYAVCDGDPGDDELFAHVRARVAAYAVPSLLVRLAALPRTGSGKIDRLALPEPAYEDRSPTPPAGAVEDAVAQAWAAVLGARSVGRDDNFFETGGSSIAAVALHQRLEAAFPGAFTLLDVFVRPTVAQLAAKLGAAADDDAKRDGVARAQQRRAARANRGARAPRTDGGG